MRVVLVVEYDGTAYCGFQLQARGPTIQGEMEKAIENLTGEKSRVAAASRTDAGVHARGQVATFRTGSPLPIGAFVGGLNHRLPADISVRRAWRVDDSFDVRRAAISREYSYSIVNSRQRQPTRSPFSHRVAGHLDEEAMDRASRALIGTRDFASFASGDGARMTSTVRRVYDAGVVRAGDMVTFRMKASSFLPHQVRNTVGSLIRVGRSAITVDEFQEIIGAAKPGRGGPTAPARGLCLERIEYRTTFGEMNG